MISDLEIPCFFFPYNGNTFEALMCLPSHFSFVGFIDDNPKLQNTAVHGFKIFHRNILEHYPKAKVFAAPGNPSNFKSRHKVIEGLGLLPHQAMNVIHNSVVVSPFSTIGKNVLIMPGVAIMPNVQIGNHVCILPNSVIHHDSIIGDYTLIGANVTVAGNVHVGKSCYIGSGSSIKNDVAIGAETLVGMGSVVINNIDKSMRIAGCPAKSIQ